MKTLFVACACALAGVASAHGPAIQITNDTGKITTRRVLVDSYEPLTDPVSAYVVPATYVEDFDFGPSWRSTPDENLASPFGPGIAYGVGGTFPTNSTLTLSFLGELERWDGATFVSAGATELAALRTSNPSGSSLAGNAGFSGGADPSAEINIGPGYTTDAHAQVTYVLLGDGVSPTSAVADGVYLATLQLSSSDLLIAPSEPFYLVLNKGPVGELASAVASLGLAPSAVQYLAIPEPMTAALVALTFVGVGSRRRG